MNTWSQYRSRTAHSWFFWLWRETTTFLLILLTSFVFGAAALPFVAICFPTTFVLTLMFLFSFFLRFWSMYELAYSLFYSGYMLVAIFGHLNKTIVEGNVHILCHQILNNTDSSPFVSISKETWTPIFLKMIFVHNTQSFSYTTKINYCFTSYRWSIEKKKKNPQDLCKILQGITD